LVGKQGNGLTSQPRTHGVWVPAFAGTTSDLLRRFAHRDALLDIELQDVVETVERAA
jgi:hypothetical protein